MPVIQKPVKYYFSVQFQISRNNLLFWIPSDMLLQKFFTYSGFESKGSTTQLRFPRINVSCWITASQQLTPNKENMIVVDIAFAETSPALSSSVFHQQRTVTQQRTI